MDADRWLEVLNYFREELLVGQSISRALGLCSQRDGRISIMSLCRELGLSDSFRR